ncbi:hypothetical protein TRFO_15815 [Tritrichomonas foetus]|uniref:Armadillo repeat-containing domain-containing protein n=1 Tax=Tritrichomonas foetus TaxID=1144522 RepID=A0A1J4KSQ5_9EUKA|nr:hypothetical protein TRFO_15815 [Tritrichomonas foetus]|eukprot:OHT13920.1 hypothetical protein TRFO_15815 [Tritrichomonas foetus]
MDYKKIPKSFFLQNPLEQLSSGFKYSFQKKNDKLYFASSIFDSEFSCIQNYPEISQMINTIHKEIDKNQEKAYIFPYLKTINNYIETPPAPSPDELSEIFLPTLLDIVNNIIDQSSRNLALKIIVFLTLGNIPTNSAFLNPKSIHIIASHLSKRIFFSSNDGFTIDNIILSSVILINLFSIPALKSKFFSIFQEIELISHINKTLNNIKSEQEAKYIFRLLLDLIKYTKMMNHQTNEPIYENHQSNAERENFDNFMIFDILGPNLLLLVSSSGYSQKGSLKCIYYLLHNKTLMDKFLQNGLPDLLFQNFYNFKYASPIFKCITKICSSNNRIIDPFNNIDFNKLIKIISSTNYKGVRDILSFISTEMEVCEQTNDQINYQLNSQLNNQLSKPLNIDFNLLFNTLLNLFDTRDFKTKLECAKYFGSILNLNITFDVNHETKMLLKIMDIVSHASNDDVLYFLAVINLHFEKNYQITMNIASETDFPSVLNELSQNELPEVSDIASALLLKYFDS